MTLWRLCREEGKSTAATMMVFTIAASFSGVFVMARPQVFSYFFFAAFLYVLTRRPKCSWALPIMTVFWANMHASVVLGVTMVWFEAVSRFVSERDKSFFPVAVATFLASLINPNGIGLLKYAVW